MSPREASRQPGSAPEFPPDTTDERLVAMYQCDPHGPGGMGAASVLLGRYRRQVLLWCGRYVRDREGALDLAQEVLLSAFRHLGSYREQDRFSAWLFIIARNRCLGELRKRRAPLADQAVLELLADPGQGPDEVLQEKLAAQDIGRLAAETLTRQEHDALWMRCFEALPVDAITRQLGITESSGARAVLQRARRKLRRALAEGGPLGGADRAAPPERDEMEGKS